MKYTFTCLFIVFCVSFSIGQNSDSLHVETPSIPLFSKFGLDKKYQIELTNSYKIIGYIKSIKENEIIIESEMTGIHTISNDKIKSISEYKNIDEPLLITKEKNVNKKIIKTDGTTLSGKIQKIDHGKIIVIEKSKRDTVSYTEIESIRIKQSRKKMPFFAINQMMLGRTAIPLEKGTLYYQTNALIDHSVTYAFEKWLSVTGGINFTNFDKVTTGAHLSGHVGFNILPKLHLGGTVEYAYNPQITSLFVDKIRSLGYLTATYGGRIGNISLSYGYGQSNLVLSEKPIISIGTTIAIRKVQLVFEFWRLDPFLSQDDFLRPISTPAKSRTVAARYVKGKYVYEIGIGVRSAFSVNQTQFGFREDFFSTPISFKVTKQFLPK